jgi:hypothetical protein
MSNDTTLLDMDTLAKARARAHELVSATGSVGMPRAQLWATLAHEEMIVPGRQKRNVIGFLRVLGDNYVLPDFAKSKTKRAQVRRAAAARQRFVRNPITLGKPFEWAFKREALKDVVQRYTLVRESDPQYPVGYVVVSTYSAETADAGFGTSLSIHLIERETQQVEMAVLATSDVHSMLVGQQVSFEVFSDAVLCDVETNNLHATIVWTGVTEKDGDLFGVVLRFIVE